MIGPLSPRQTPEIVDGSSLGSYPVSLKTTTLQMRSPISPSLWEQGKVSCRGSQARLPENHR